MDTETAANPAGEEVVATVEDGIETLPNPLEANTPAAGSEPEADPLDDLTKEALGSEDANPELVEVEYEGEKFTLPPKLKDALLRQADYTKKTMAVADERKALESERKSFEAIASQTTEELQASAQLLSLNERIEQLSKTPIAGLSQEQINALRLDLQDLTRQRDGLNHRLQSHFQAKQQRESEEIAKSRDECLKKAATEVPNFNDTRRAELEALAVDLGVSPEDVGAITEVSAYKILHLADIGQKFIERQRNAAKMKAASAGKPATQVGGNADGGKSPEDMSMEEYIAARNAGKI